MSLFEIFQKLPQGFHNCVGFCEALLLLFYLLVSLIALFSVHYIIISQLDDSDFFLSGE